MMGPLGAMQESNPLVQALGKLQQNTLGGSGVTLGNQQAQQDYAQQMAEALARMRSADSQQGIAESMMQPEYVQNSGLLGSLAMMAQAAAGKKMAGRASKEDAAAREAYYKGQSAAEQEKARKEAEKAQAEMQAKIDAYNKNDPALDAVFGFKREKPQQTEYDIREVNGKLFYVPKSPVMAQQQNSPAANAGFQALRDAVMWQESRGNPNAVSPKGAMGTMQTMPNTLRDPGYGVAPARDNSPQEMERVGTDYLKAMTGKYGLEGGLAAYNWGPGNWEKALQAAGGDPQRALQMAPRETQQYVPSVLGRVGSGGGAGAGFGLGQGAGVPAGAIPVDGVPSTQPQTVQTLSPDEIKAIGLPAGTVAQRKPDGTISVVNKPDAPKPSAAGGGVKALGAEAANKVGLYDNAIRAGRQWFDLVAEKDGKGNYTGGYNNIAAMSPAAKSLYEQALRAKLRAESGASISSEEIAGEMERYGAKFLGGDATDLRNAAALLNDLVTQRKSLVGSGADPAKPAQNGGWGIEEVK